MCCNRSLNKMNRLHDQCLRIGYSNKTSNVSGLLEKDDFISIYYQNIRPLATEMFKSSRGF